MTPGTDGETLPLKRLMLVGGAHSWKYDFLNAFADFPKRRWVASGQSVGRDEGYFLAHYNEELFESALNCYHLRCMENACYTLHELGQALPDGLVLIQNGLEPPEDEVLSTLRLARRAGIDRLCVFLDWPEELLGEADFAAMERQQAAALRQTLREIGFGGEVPFTSGDASRLLDPPDMDRRPGGNGADPRAIYAGRVRSGAGSALSRWGAAVLDMLDGQYPERPEAFPAFLRLEKLEKAASPKRLTADFALEAGVVRTGAPFFLMLPGCEPEPVHIGKLRTNGHTRAFGGERQEVAEAFYDGSYRSTPYTATLALSRPWEEALPPAAWLAKRPEEMREVRALTALIAYPDYEKIAPGARPGEDAAVAVLVQAEDEELRGEARFLPAGTNGLPAGVREAAITLSRPLRLPAKARVALLADDGAGVLWGVRWWYGVAADL